MDQITALVIIAERRAKALRELHLHKISDPDHRSLCAGCLTEWVQAK